jgi:predicted Zn-dependent peptidase
MAVTDNGAYPAFHQAHPAGPEAGKGLNKREWLAGLAMQGILAREGSQHLDQDQVAQKALASADSLLSKL